MWNGYSFILHTKLINTLHSELTMKGKALIIDENSAKSTKALSNALNSTLNVLGQKPYKNCRISCDQAGRIRRRMPE